MYWDSGKVETLILKDIINRIWSFLLSALQKTPTSKECFLTHLGSGSPGDPPNSSPRRHMSTPACVFEAHSKKGAPTPLSALFLTSVGLISQTGESLP